MSLRQAASLSILALMSATGVLADVTAVRNPPSFSSEEMKLINSDKQLTLAAKNCPWQLRQALDVWDDIRHGSRVLVEPERCHLPSDEPGRASDEGALDILKILKEAAGQGTNRLQVGK